MAFVILREVEMMQNYTVCIKKTKLNMLNIKIIYYIL